MAATTSKATVRIITQTQTTATTTVTGSLVSLFDVWPLRDVSMTSLPVHDDDVMSGITWSAVIRTPWLLLLWALVVKCS